MTAFGAPRKRLGQHFLHDLSVVDRMVRAFNPQSNQQIVEIGPGRGVLTKALVQHVARLDVVELDHALAHWLSDESPMREQLTVHRCDALKFDYRSLAHTDQRLRIIGNLPYQISSPLLFQLLALGPLINDMCFMLQKEFVDRVLATPGNSNYGRLTVMANRYCEGERLFNVAPGAFTPPPRVDSAIIRLYPKSPSVLDEDRFADIVRSAFSARRKTLRNGLKGLVSTRQIEDAGVDPGARPETISLDGFEALARQVSSDGDVDQV